MCFECERETSSMRGRVVKQLSQAMIPTFTHINVDWGEFSPFVVEQTPKVPPPTYFNETLHVFAFIRKDESTPRVGDVRISMRSPDGEIG